MTTVLVIGSGPNVSDELSMIDRDAFDYVLGVNQAAIDFGPVDLHCTLHPETYAAKKVARMVANRAHRGVDEIFSSLWRNGGASGSSGLYAVKYALHRLSANVVVLAGVSISVEPHYYSKDKWLAAKRFRTTWREEVDRLRGRVFSLGGWTADLLNSGDPLEQPELRQFITTEEASYV